MGQHGDRVKQALLDAAEELFATRGIDAVSNRHIAEHAGNANHSAVSYHFGGRDQLVRALMLRYSDETRHRRRDLADLLGENADLRDVLGCLILPWTDQLSALPRGSRRARFVQQLRSAPSEAELIAILSDPLINELMQRIAAVLSDVPDSVLSGRLWVVGRMVVDVCAQYESRVELDSIEPDWTGLGYFLIDAASGMLPAPVTGVSDFLRSRTPSPFP